MRPAESSEWSTSPSRRGPMTATRRGEPPSPSACQQQREWESAHARSARSSALLSKRSIVRDVQVQFAPLVAHTHVQVQRSSNDRDSSHKCCLRLEAVAKDFPVERQCVGAHAELKRRTSV